MSLASREGLNVCRARKEPLQVGYQCPKRPEMGRVGFSPQNHLKLATLYISVSCQNQYNRNLVFSLLLSNIQTVYTFYLVQ